MSTPPTATSSAELEPGSFRDPESRVFYAGDDVYRVLSQEGLEDYETVAATSFWKKFSDAGSIVSTELVEGGQVPAGMLAKDAAGVLKHERIPFVSYPYEWPFSMLQEAALLQLDLNLAALEEDMILKDSTPYNVQFKGSKPVLIDIGSFERLREGEPWVGYRQFCMLYLYPLLLQATKDVSYHALLRGAIDGIPPAQMRGMVSFRDRFRKGFYLNVFLHGEARGAPCPPRQGSQGRGQEGRLQEGADRRQRPPHAKARRRPGVEPAGRRLGRLRRAQQLHGRRREAQGRVHPRGRHLAAVEPHLGHRREQRALLAHRRRGLEARGGGRLRPGPDGAAAPRPSARRATSRSSRSR